MYSNSWSSCSFEVEIIKIGQSPHKMYSNNIVNFQESTTILNAYTKKVWKIIVCTSYIYIYIYIYMYIYVCVCVCVCVSVCVYFGSISSLIHISLNIIDIFWYISTGFKINSIKFGLYVPNM